MRFAISAAAALSGLVLLGVSFYGQPAVYLHQAVEQWDALMDRPAADLPPDPDGDAAHERVLRLQREIERLKQELATKQATDPSPDADASLAPAALPPSPPDLSASASRPTPGLVAPAQSGTTPSAQGPSGPAALALIPPASTAVVPGSFGPTGQTQAPTPPAQPQATQTQAAPPPPLASASPPPPAAVAPPPARPSAATQAATPVPAVTPPVRPSPVTPSATAAAPPKPLTLEALRNSLSLPAPPPPPRVAMAPAATNAGVPAPERHDDPPKPPPPPKQLASKPMPAPPPLPQPAVSQSGVPQTAPARQDEDDTQSILARLRQGSSVGSPPQQPDPPPSADRRPKSVSASAASLPRLAAARAALASGRIDETRRLLQEAQLQLVFRPVDLLSEDSSGASRGAADVAHALEALSANDTVLSRRYIDVALDDLSGNTTSAPVQESTRRATGYAPAYPPR